MLLCVYLNGLNINEDIFCLDRYWLYCCMFGGAVQPFNCEWQRCKNLFVNCWRVNSRNTKRGFSNKDVKQSDLNCIHDVYDSPTGNVFGHD